LATIGHSPHIFILHCFLSAAALCYELWWWFGILFGLSADKKNWRGERSGMPFLLLYGQYASPPPPKGVRLFPLLHFFITFGGTKHISTQLILFAPFHLDCSLLPLDSPPHFTLWTSPSLVSFLLGTWP
jgi:hypothetical protein